MSKTKNPGFRRAAGIVGLSTALLMTACGSDDESTDASTATTAAAATTGPTTTAGASTDSTAASDSTATGDSTATSDSTDTSDSTATSDSTDTGSSEVVTTEAAEVPEHDPDAIVKVIGYSPPANVDPVRGVPACELTHLRMIYDSLIRIDANGTPQPGLAESWEVLDDTSFQLNLRQGVTFQDGTPFDAEAVKAHLERAKTNPESTVTGALEVVDSVEVIDDHTLVLHLNKPRAGTLPTILAERAGMVPSPTAVAAAGEAYGTDNAVGAGPYAFDSLVPAQSLKVRTWGGSDYWADDQRLVAGLDFFPVDDTLGIQRVQSGEIDYMATKDSNLAVAEDSGLEHLLSPTNTFAQIFLNYGVAPFDDIRVRQALNYSIDRELLVETLSGSGQVAWGPLNPTSWGHSPDVDEMYPYDPEKAKSLLAEAGFPDGLTFTAAMIDNPYYTRMAQAVQDMVKDSGITINLELVPGPEINNALYVRKDYSAAITAYAGSSDPSITLEAKYTSYGNSNPSGQTVDGLEDLLAEGARLVDQDERAAKYQEAEQLVMENALEVPIFFLGGLSVFNDHVGGITKGYETCSIGNFIQPPVYVTP